MKTKLTATLIEKMKPHQCFWDERMIGFGVRTQTTTSPRYIVKTTLNGRPKFITVGRHGALTLDQARKQARQILGEVAQGKDPVSDRRAAREATRLTLRAVSTRWLSEHVAQKRKPSTYESYRYLLQNYILPQLGSTSLNGLNRTKIIKLHDSLRSKPRTANMVLAVLSSFWTWCVRRGLVEGENPVRYIERNPENKCERFLSPDELARLGKALTEYEPHHFFAVVALRLLILTGARRGEILSLRWDEVDFEGGFLRLADSKTGPKNIALPGAVAEILNELPRLEGNPYVIPGGKAGRPLVNLNDPWGKIRSMAGLDDVRIHDLRHSYASVAVSGGMGLPQIGKLLGHSQTQTTHRYAHLADAPVKSAAETVSGEIANLLGGEKPQKKTIAHI